MVQYHQRNLKALQVAVLDASCDRAFCSEQFLFLSILPLALSQSILKEQYMHESQSTIPT
jgi:hypothetical protein